MSTHLQWPVTCKRSSFPIKRNKQRYSTEPRDVKPRDSFSYNGLIHRRTVGVEPAGVGNGVVVVMSGDPASKSRPAPTGGPPSTTTPSTRDLQEQLAPGPAHGRHPELEPFCAARSPCR